MAELDILGKVQAFLLLFTHFSGPTCQKWQMGSGRPRQLSKPCHTMLTMHQPTSAYVFYNHQFALDKHLSSTISGWKNGNIRLHDPSCGFVSGCSMLVIVAGCWLRQGKNASARLHPLHQQSQLRAHVGLPLCRRAATYRHTHQEPMGWKRSQKSNEG